MTAVATQSGRSTWAARNCWNLSLRRPPDYPITVARGECNVDGPKAAKIIDLLALPLFSNALKGVRVEKGVLNGKDQVSGPVFFSKWYVPLFFQFGLNGDNKHGRELIVHVHEGSVPDGHMGLGPCCVGVQILRICVVPIGRNDFRPPRGPTGPDDGLRRVWLLHYLVFGSMSAIELLDQQTDVVSLVPFLNEAAWIRHCEL